VRAEKSTENGSESKPNELDKIDAIIAKNIKATIGVIVLVHTYAPGRMTVRSYNPTNVHRAFRECLLPHGWWLQHDEWCGPEWVMWLAQEAA
jgi:hypothetical protein